MVVKESRDFGTANVSNRYGSNVRAAGVPLRRGLPPRVKAVITAVTSGTRGDVQEAVFPGYSPAGAHRFHMPEFIRPRLEALTSLRFFAAVHVVIFHLRTT